ncbi:MAG: glycosyltransferase family 39 protein [Ktedonobacteraceae bacterium]|nr:glycosyltransferase family 39 protein [Ktedonobacteraceae bacterium]
MVEQSTVAKKVDEQQRPHRSPLAILVPVAALMIVAVSVWLRLRVLNAPYDIDSYDEGVYWQSLRAMSEGHMLYGDIFYSQPPFFLLAVFPMYVLLGKTIWAARMGIVIISLLGMLGAYLLGKALAGRAGALVALLLLALQPLFIGSSVVLQADSPSMALTLLAVALAFLWWQHRHKGLTGTCLAALCGVVLALSIGTKLFGLSALVPFGLLILAHLWLDHRESARSESGARLRALARTLQPLGVGLLACAVTAGVLLIPFAGSWHQLLDNVITFHVASGESYTGAPANVMPTIKALLLSLLPLTALCGTVLALIRRDARVWPLLAWLGVTIALLWQQKPLFTHHFIILLPPLVGLSALGVNGLVRVTTGRLRTLLQPSLLLALLVILIVLPWNAREAYTTISTINGHSQSEEAQQNLRVAADLRQALPPGQQVLTDAQFLAGLADRTTPPALVDTSGVRIDAGYVTAQSLIDAASSPEVHAVLIYSGRFTKPQLAPFISWLHDHYRLVQDYGNQRGLWVKV